MLRRIAALPLRGPPSRSVRKHTEKSAATGANGCIVALPERKLEKVIPAKSFQFFASENLRTKGGEMRHGLIWLVMAVAAITPAFGSFVTVDLDSASTFALLGSTITNTGTSHIKGDVGATTTITDTGPWVVTGTVYSAGDPTAIAAYDDFETAFSTTLGLGTTQPVLTSLGLTQAFTGNNVYKFTNTISTTSGTALTFDAQYDPNEVFVIQVDGDFTVNGVLTFDLINGAQAKNIFWIVEDAAAISVGSNPPQTFDGSILAGTTFTMYASGLPGGSGVLGGTIDGCVFARTANVLAGETDVNGCVGGGLPCGGPGGGVPEPGSSELVSLGCLLGILAWRKIRVSL
jgi:Ice-binding-like